MRDAAGLVWYDVQFPEIESPTLIAAWIPDISGSVVGGAEIEIDVKFMKPNPDTYTYDDKGKNTKEKLEKWSKYQYFFLTTIYYLYIIK